MLEYNNKPTDKPSFVFLLQHNSTIEEIKEFLHSIPYEFELQIPRFQFGNNLINYVSAHKNETTYDIFQPNHGKINYSATLEINDLALGIHKSRNLSGSDKLRVLRK